MKRANQPVQLIYDYQRHAVFAVNETLQPVALTASMRRMDGTTDIQNQMPLTLQPGAVVKVFDIPAQDADAFLFLAATDAAGANIAVNDYFLPAGCDEYDWKNTNWVTTPITRYASYRTLNTLPRITCQMKVKTGTITGTGTSTRTGTLTGTGIQNSKLKTQNYEITLSNPFSTVAFFQRLTVKDAQGALVCPAYWSDNYVTLAPGETRTITCTLPALDSHSKIHFEIESF